MLTMNQFYRPAVRLGLIVRSSASTRARMAHKVPAAVSRFDVTDSRVSRLENDQRHIMEGMSAIRESTTKEICAVRQEISIFRESVTNEFSAVRQEIGVVRQEIGVVRQEIGAVRQEIGAVRQEVSSLEVRMTKEFSKVKEETAQAFTLVYQQMAALNERITQESGALKLAIHESADRQFNKLCVLFTLVCTVMGVLFQLNKPEKEAPMPILTSTLPVSPIITEESGAPTFISWWGSLFAENSTSATNDQFKGQVKGAAPTR